MPVSRALATASSAARTIATGPAARSASKVTVAPLSLVLICGRPFRSPRFIQST